MSARRGSPVPVLVPVPVPVVAVLWILLGALVAAEAQTQSPPEPLSCAQRSNSSCAECLQNVTCLWCEPTKVCTDYPVGSILPPSSLCHLNDARWGLCWVNFQALIITMSVLAGAILIAVLVCCCCCCCKCERTLGSSSRDDARAERQDRARKARQRERRTEMHMRHDEIRQKYGLAKNNPYARMDER